MKLVNNRFLKLALTMALLSILIFFAIPSFAAEDILSKAEAMIKSNKNVEDAKQMIARYLTANETADAYVKVGNLYARVREWSNSVHYLEIASKRNEKSAAIWYELGLVQHQNKETDAAVTSLRKSLAISSTTAKTYTALGEILELSRDKYDARNIYISALAKAGNQALFHSKLCWLNFQDNFLAESINQCQKAVHMNGNDVTSWALLAQTFYQNQQRPKAFDILKKLIAQHPNSALLYRVRGLIYFQEKAYEQAINDLGKAFGLDPSDDEAAIHLARSYFELTYYDRALPIYVEACKLDKDYRFEFLSKQRELSRKDHDDLATQYQLEVDKF
jgi:tetratricopeptide (TPR) repeat protein